MNRIDYEILEQALSYGFLLSYPPALPYCTSMEVIRCCRFELNMSSARHAVKSRVTNLHPTMNIERMVPRISSCTSSSRPNSIKSLCLASRERP
ncbi:hypothetical protein QL093DRAFT_2284473 [Fusarium oxysporum]|nr:hypothetical protein QL093DRAFT_2284473 [Fusarium oxysporum]